MGSGVMLFSSVMHSVLKKKMNHISLLPGWFIIRHSLKTATTLPVAHFVSDGEGNR